jgi:hypothetical protein
MVREVADRFLLGQKIKFCMDIRFESNRSYALSAQSSSEQDLYLELAALTFIAYVSQNKSDHLDLQFFDDISAKMSEDVLSLTYIKDGRQVIKSLKIDKQACARSFRNLVNQNTQLAGFAYNIDQPVQTAQRLWKQLLNNANTVQDEDDSSHQLDQSWGCCIA